MTVEQISQQLNLTVFGGNKGLNTEITGGYTSDLLSDVMGFAAVGSVWITLQTHKNVMAIASLKDLAAIVLVKGFTPDPDTLAQANEEGIPILGSKEQSFELSAKIYNLLN
ncbi:MAG: serine kinase [Prevotellaceae bacterium]|jgi:serine kinase of HPr protein (carbohydrate metabolism regulator)|nr:serine kinase [Prevotellaceae bacterium]